MSAVLPAPATAAVAVAAAPKRSRRDPAIDLVRNASLVIVVLLHTMMFGVTVTPEGPVFANAIEGDAWFPPATWLLQVVPLFFLAGGFGSLSAWRATQASGGTAAGYVARRVERLLVPVLVLGATVGVLLVLAASLGMPAEWIAQASLRTSQPLWFLAVYVIATSLVPLLAAAHDRAPRRTLAALVAGAVLVDALRAVTGADLIGAFNYAFVWLAVQQLGFWYLEGSPRRWSRRTAGWIVAASAGVLVVLTSSFGYPVDLLLAGNNPASVALVVLAVGQLAALRLAHPALIRLARRARVARANAWFAERGMTLYLWHMPVLVALTGLLLVVGFWMPAPHTLEWWLTRPVFVGLLALALLPVLALFRGFERGVLAHATAPSTWRAAVASVAAGAAVVVLLLAGFAPIAPPAVAIALGCVALGLLSSPGAIQPAVIRSGHVAHRGRRPGIA